MSDLPEAYDLLAGEYVIGLLNDAESTAVENLAAREGGVVIFIEEWKRRLAPLALVVPPVTPPDTLWPRIAAAIGGFEEPAAEPPPVAAANDAVEEPPAEPPPVEAAVEAFVAPPPVVEPPPVAAANDAVEEPPAEPPPVEAVVEAFVAPPVVEPPPVAAANDAVEEPRAEPPPPEAVEAVAVPPLTAVPPPIVPPVVATPVAGSPVVGPSVVEPPRAGAEVIGLFRRPWNNVAVWRATTAVALAASVVLGFFAFQHRPARVPQFAAALAPANTPAPAFLAETLASGMILVRPMSPITVAADQDLELWALPQGASKPVSLGVLPAQGLNVQPEEAVQASTQLMISLEPKGGSPTGLPTGPVLYAGTLARIH